MNELIFPQKEIKLKLRSHLTFFHNHDHVVLLSTWMAISYIPTYVYVFPFCGPLHSSTAPRDHWIRLKCVRNRFVYISDIIKRILLA